MDRMFLNDKYRNIYNLPYNHFVVQLIKSENNIIEDSNCVISDFISQIGNPEGITGIHNWIDKLSMDEVNINRTSPTIEIRNKVQNFFCGKLSELMNQNLLIETVIPHKVIEAVFFKVSANVYCDVIDKLAKQKDGNILNKDSIYKEWIEEIVSIRRKDGESESDFLRRVTPVVKKIGTGRLDDNKNDKYLKSSFDRKITLKIIIAILSFVLLYLFVLNGRYEHIGGGHVLDKWKKEILQGGSEYLPIKE